MESIETIESIRGINRYFLLKWNDVNRLVHNKVEQLTQGGFFILNTESESTRSKNQVA